MKPDFDWLASLNYHGNLLIFIDTHSDTVTGDLVVSGNAANSNAVPVYEVSRSNGLDTSVSTDEILTLLVAGELLGRKPSIGLQRNCQNQ